VSRIGITAWSLAACIAALFAAPASAQEIHSALCLYGCPYGTPQTNDLIIRDIYILSSNDDAKFADWAAYRITASTIASSKERIWRADPYLAPEETLEPEDYAGASAALSTDRGHQVPLASFAGSGHAADTNFLSNITPQKSALNAGAWERLESAERTLAKREGSPSVYVMTGLVYLRDMPPLPKADEPHKVPSGYWKIVSIQDAGSLKVASFFFDQETQRKELYCDHLTTIADIESKTGLRFFHELSQLAVDELRQAPASLKSEIGCHEVEPRP
jgi:endonuclease G